jgi:hypothetical protein
MRRYLLDTSPLAALLLARPAHLADAHLLRVLRDEVVPEQRIRRGLDPLDLHVLFGHAEAGVADRLGKLHLLAQALHENAEALRIGSREADFLASAHHGRNHQNREVHKLSLVVCMTTVRACERTAHGAQ